ncbi:MAG: hypothetical protein QW835_00245 [Candidatus Hadarchaeum sp.]
MKKISRKLLKKKIKAAISEASLPEAEWARGGEGASLKEDLKKVMMFLKHPKNLEDYVRREGQSAAAAKALEKAAAAKALEKEQTGTALNKASGVLRGLAKEHPGKIAAAAAALGAGLGALALRKKLAGMKKPA